MSGLQCKDCPYCYKDEDDRYPCCHFTEIVGEPSWLDVPPCEESAQTYEEAPW